MEAISILVAADDQDQVAAVRRALKHILNDLTVLSDEERARDRLLRRGEFADERRSPDLAILDAQMLGRDCYELVEKYREDELGDTVIAVIDEFPTMSRMETARRAGVDAYAPKPLDLKSLAELLQDVPGINMAVVKDGSVEVR